MPVDSHCQELSPAAATGVSLQAPSPVRSFRPGDPAPSSGIYLAIHDGHRSPHEISACEGELFPRCRSCDGRVRFELLHTAEPMTRDWDFAAFSLELVKGSRKKKTL